VRIFVCREICEVYCPSRLSIKVLEYSIAAVAHGAEIKHTDCTSFLGTCKNILE
jgi:hypothetical protein